MTNASSPKAGLFPDGGTTDLATAAALLGIGRTTAYAQARQGTFPVPLIRVGTRLRVLVEPLQAILRGELATDGRSTR